MTLAAWLFSAKRAWQDPWIKGVTVFTVVFGIIGSAWFIAHMLPLRHATHGRLVLHYSVYFGIDAIKPWGWLFALPVCWIVSVMIDVVWSLGVYREDAYQAWAILFVASISSIPWMMTLWHLIGINR